ncbi:hypothetical protein [Kocuria sp.]|uniref:hypothetical protein n=1 Tax=Kocuria sp. TaxID=1871328 RepID=UPI0026E0B356|nr:hypothetical protein [Kocuria sp.]MDO5618405.1 hypothetical protein [Kocuria sp.]
MPELPTAVVVIRVDTTPVAPEDLGRAIFHAIPFQGFVVAMRGMVSGFVQALQT